MLLRPDAYMATEFGAYVKHLHSSKKPLQHRCSMTITAVARKETAVSQLLKRLYVYLVLLPYDHHATKLYHNSFDSVDQARSQHVSKYPCILHPLSRLKVFFDTFLWIPYLISKLFLCSIPIFVTSSLPNFFYTISLISLIVGTFLIIVNFMTGYCQRKKRRVILRPLKIFTHYISSYFLIDTGMLVPHVLLLLYDPGTLHIVNIFYFVTFLRCVTLLDCIEHFLLILTFSKKIINRITLVVKFLLIIQVCSCIMGYARYQYGLYATSEEENDWRKDYVVYVNELITETVRQYYSAYIDRPNKPLITVLIVLSIIVGTVTFSYIMAAVLLDLLAEVAQESKHNQLASEVNNFARQKHRDPVARQRIIQMFDVIFLGTILTEQRVKQTVPDNIRRDLNEETVGVLLKNARQLSKLDDYLLLRLIDKLRLVVLLPNDYLVTEGEIGDCMYFLSAGRLVLYFMRKEVGHLDDGDNLAEEALLTEEYVHRETAMAASACFVYKLSKSDFVSTTSL